MWDASHRSERQAGLYVGAIQPGSLPVMPPTGFELVVNRRTAAAHGIDPPRALLLSADEVIG